MGKIPKSEVKTELKNGIFQCRNLKFMTEFMKLNNISTPDIADRIGISRQSVHHMLSVDDMRLSMAERIISAFGYTLDIDLVKDGDIPPLDIEEYLQKFPRTKVQKNRMTFLRAASIRYGIDLKTMGQRAGLGMSTMAYYTQNDDIFIAQLMMIAESCEMKVKITITENDIEQNDEDDEPGNQIIEIKQKRK